MRRLVHALALLGAVLALPLSLSAQRVRTESYQGRSVVSGEILVRFRAPDAAASRAAAVSVAASDADLRSETVGTTGAVLLRSSRRTTARLLQDYASRTDVLYAQPNYVYHATELPNDQFFFQQWGLNNTGQNIGGQGTPGADIHASAAWDITTGNRAYAVGVIDSGVNYNHPDLAPNMWSAPSAYNVTIGGIGGTPIQCPAGSHGVNIITKTCDPMDDEGHGTHVSGILGAAGNNGFGVSGVSRETSIVGIKFLDNTGAGFTSDAVAAVNYAIQLKAIFGVAADIRVLNNSWAGDGFDQTLLDEINTAGNATNKMLFVAAAGNDGRNNDITKNYPASFGAAPYNAPSVIAVAATTNQDGLASFSNFGASSVHIGAPGSRIFSTLLSGSFGSQSGTSMATPMVAGAAALVLAGCGNLSVAQLRTALLSPSSVDAIPALAGRTTTGGRLNVLKALNSCGATTSTFSLSASQNFNTLAAGNSVTSSIVSGVGSPVNLSVTAPLGFSTSLGSTTLGPNGSTTLTVTPTSAVAPGIYLVSITGTNGAMTKTMGVSVVVVPNLTPGQFTMGALSSSDQPDPSSLTNFADYYQLTLATPKTLIVDLLPSFDGMLSILDSSGAGVLAENNGTAGSDVSVSASLSAGTYLVKVRSSFAGLTGSYSLYVNGPILSSVNPATGSRGASAPITLQGTRFLSGMTVDAGADIGVGPIALVNESMVTTSLNIGSQAALGTRNVSVSTLDGTSNAVSFTVVPVAPVLTGINPVSGVRGTVVDATLTGINFFAPVTIVSTGLSVTSINLIGSTMATATLVLGSGTGSFDVVLNTAGGPSNAVTFTVLPPAATLTGISPASAKQGATASVTLTGTDFTLGLAVNAGGGIAVSNVVVPSSTSATATFNIGPSAALGSRAITVTNVTGTSGPVAFTVLPPNPQLSTIVPNGGLRNTNMTVTLQGANFQSGLAINIAGVGTGIQVSNINVIDSATATASFAIASNAVFGSYAVTVSTVDGTSPVSASFSILPSAPVITSIVPANVLAGTTANVTLNGTNLELDSGVNALVDAGSGVTFQSAVTIVPATQIRVTLAIHPNTSPGPRNLTFITTGGSSNAATLTINPAVPVITSMSPLGGAQGLAYEVTLTGQSFIPNGTTIDPVAGITFSNYVVPAPGLLKATFTIDFNAGLGPRNIRATTAGGTSNAVNFTVSPALPDMTVSSTHTAPFAAGFNDTYTVIVSNVGALATSSAITLSGSLPGGVTFVSVSGAQWGCTVLSQTFSCTRTSAMAGSTSSVLTVTVAVGPNVVNAFDLSLSVSTPNESATSNNAFADSTSVLPTPTPVFFFTPDPLVAGHQAQLSLRLPSAFPHDVTGTLVLGFTSNAAIPVDDPAIQFSSGGRSVSYSIPANTVEARFGSSSEAGPIAFQTGTVSGTLTFNGTLQAGTATKTFQPSVGLGVLTIPKSPPAIQTVQATRDSANPSVVTAAIQLSSTMREVTSISLQFNVGSSLKLGCGGVSGCFVSGSTITLNVKSLFDAWFASDVTFGSLSTLRLPMFLSGSVQGSVAVTLRNSQGGSNAVTFTLP